MEESKNSKKIINEDLNNLENVDPSENKLNYSEKDNQINQNDKKLLSKTDTSDKDNQNKSMEEKLAIEKNTIEQYNLGKLEEETLVVDKNTTEQNNLGKLKEESLIVDKNTTEQNNLGKLKEESLVVDNSINMNKLIENKAKDLKRIELSKDEPKVSKVDKDNDESKIKKTVEDKKSINAEIKPKAKPVKEIPIEKKPFNQFIGDHLIPELNKVFSEIGKEITVIKMEKTNRPVAGDECWVIYCEIKETCRFWLSFNNNDILSPKSFSLCRNDEEPSVLESFLIDEKKITLKLIISRILQRLNGQKLIGAN